ncbi:hypothetical protein MASR1M31_08050 [Porphyromonadaceae bacterium]
MSAGDAWELSERTIPTGKRLPSTICRRFLSKEYLHGNKDRKAMSNSPIVEDGASYYGAIITDRGANVTVCYEVSPEFDSGHCGTTEERCPTSVPNPSNMDNAPQPVNPRRRVGIQTGRTGSYVGRQ